MIHSMTAFARCDAHTRWGELAWEIRSVNHRYLDIAPKLPEAFRVLEPQVRDRLAARLARGKVDCTLYFRPLDSGAALELDEALLERLVALAQRVKATAPGAQEIRVMDLLRWPGVVRAAEADADGLHPAALDLLDEALSRLVEARRREGDHLSTLLEQRLAAIEAVCENAKAIEPQAVEHFRQRLSSRLEELKTQVDPARLEQEIALFAQKVDVHEELDRLAGHVSEVRRVLARGGAVGRRLDFLMQELNREANTLGAKATDMRLVNASVELKVLIEQMREQIQNIE